MSVRIETVIHFLIAHNETIILATVGLICLLSMVVVYFQVFGKKGLLNDGEKAEYDFTKIEDSLKKILSQTQGAIVQVSSSTAASGGATSGPELANLKKELEERMKIIEELRSQVGSAKSDDHSGELLAKIKTLEGKLAEYEIIEDDIADLSHFKEENSRLKKELESIKRGGPELVDQFAAALEGQPKPDAPAAAPASSVAAAPGESTSGPTMAVKNAAAAGAAEASLESIVAQAQSAAPNIVNDLSTGPGETLEFGNDGSSKVTPAAGAAQAPAAAPAASTSPAPNPVQSSGGAPTSGEVKGDIFAEFSGAPAQAADPLAELGDIDTNRMLEELKDLNMDMNVGAEALDEAPDIDKMAAEAQTLDKKS